MNPKIKELRQKRFDLIQEMHDLTEKTSFPEESQKRYDELDKEQKALEAQITRMESSDKLLEEQRKVNAPPQPDPAASNTAENRGTQGSPENAVKRYSDKLESAEYRAAFVDYLRSGITDCSRESRAMLNDTLREARTYTGLNIGTGSQGGYVVPIGFQKELEVKMKTFGRMREVCRILKTDSGNTLDWPTMDDTGNSGRWLSEASAVSQTNPAFGQIQFGANLASSDQVLLSVQLMQDSAFDLEEELKNAFAIRLGRTTNLGYTKGTGSGQPDGLITAILAQASPNTVKATGSNSNDGIGGSTEANSIGSDDLDSLIAGVDPAYRANARFMFHWQTIDGLRRLKDKQGRPLWVASLAVGEPDRIFGYPYDWNADMDAIGASKYPALFGDFSKYVIRDVAGISVVRFNELFMGNHQIAFQAFLRTDGQLIQPAAFSLLWNPAS